MLILVCYLFGVPLPNNPWAWWVLAHWGCRSFERADRLIWVRSRGPSGCAVVPSCPILLWTISHSNGTPVVRSWVDLLWVASFVFLTLCWGRAAVRQMSRLFVWHVLSCLFRVSVVSPLGVGESVSHAVLRWLLQSKFKISVRLLFPNRPLHRRDYLCGWSG